MTKNVHVSPPFPRVAHSSNQSCDRRRYRDSTGIGSVPTMQEHLRPRGCELVEYDAAHRDVRDIYDDIKATLGVVQLPNWVKAMGGNATLLRGNWEKTKAVLAAGALPPLLKELVIFYISTRRGSEYCSACHAHAALQIDRSLTMADLMGIARGELATLPASYQVALEVTSTAALDPASLSDGDFARLREVGFSEDEMPELLALADLSVMFNTITMTYRVPLDPEYSRVL
jgi:alkylhydroperoxidase family enzyme